MAINVAAAVAAAAAAATGTTASAMAITGTTLLATGRTQRDTSLPLTKLTRRRKQSLSSHTPAPISTHQRRRMLLRQSVCT
jgi:hypothetical protein